ncbi:hypothetical protein ACEPAF_9225 [Sanghuangporus sanghuang]
MRHCNVFKEQEVLVAKKVVAKKKELSAHVIQPQLFCSHPSRRTTAEKSILGAAAGAVAASTNIPRREELPTYPTPEPQLSWVDRWIAIEHAVEKRIKGFKSPEEQITPGVLYVGIATLSGSILARSRSRPTRFLLPPVLLLLSSNYFLPKTTSNIGSYVSDLEHTYFPRAARFTDTAVAHSQMTWEMAENKANEGKEALNSGVEKTIGAIQDATGLKPLALAVEEQRKAVLQAAEEQGKEAAKKVEETVGKKVKRLV